MKSEVSLSTMWSLKYEQMTEFIHDSVEFGFTHVELNSILTPENLKKLRLMDSLKVSSVHAPCPNLETSEGMARALSLSSFDKDERLAAVQSVKSAIDLAVEVRAKVVVVHVGYADMNPEMEKDLRDLWRQGKMKNPEYAKLKRKLMEARQSLVYPHVDAAKESLLELAAYGRAKGIQLALENRVNFHEIPNLVEMMDILCEFPPEIMGYWHDIGHAEIQSRIGFTPHEDWFAGLSDRMVGIHLHDVKGLQDHCAPSTGDINWNMVAQNLPEDVIRVCEIGEWNDSINARNTVSFLRDKGII